MALRVYQKTDLWDLNVYEKITDIPQWGWDPCPTREATPP